MDIAALECVEPSMETERAEFSISDLAREFDITPRAIRFYEDQGLLAPRREGQRRKQPPSTWRPSALPTKAPVR